TDTESATVTVSNAPNAGISGDLSICNGESTTLTASGGGTYLWSTGSTNASITVSPSSTTTYSVTVTNAGGCTDTESAMVTVSNAPNAGISGDLSICNGESTTLTASGGGTYLWSTGSTNASITVSPSSTTTYSVTVTNAGGCTDTESA